MFGFRHKTQMIDPARALPGRDRDAGRGAPRRARHAAQAAVPGGASSVSSAWAASGAPSASSGRRPACTRPRSATPAATRRTRPTRRCAAGAPATPRPCSSSSTRPRSPTRRCCALFWENHDPTQGMRQGNDVGTQYRSAIYCDDRGAARRGRGLARRATPSACAPPATPEITTEIAQAGPFYYAEDYHQQYLHKNPGGYCGLGGTGVSCPVGARASAPGPGAAEVDRRGACRRAGPPRGRSAQPPATAGRIVTSSPSSTGVSSPSRKRMSSPPT